MSKAINYIIIHKYIYIIVLHLCVYFFGWPAGKNSIGKIYWPLQSGSGHIHVQNVVFS